MQIARELTLNSRRQARLRTTLAHEYGHVLLHNFAQDLPEWHDRSVESADAVDHPAMCHPNTVIQSPGIDWMEWQAAYVSGALLMPRTAVADFIRSMSTSASDGGQRTLPLSVLLARIQGNFLVSEAAAYVRLRQLGHTAGGHHSRLNLATD